MMIIPYSSDCGLYKCYGLLSERFKYYSLDYQDLPHQLGCFVPLIPGFSVLKSQPHRIVSFIGGTWH